MATKPISFEINVCEKPVHPTDLASSYSHRRVSVKPLHNNSISPNSIYFYLAIFTTWDSSWKVTTETQALTVIL